MINRQHYVARYPLGDGNAEQNEYLFHEWQLIVYEEPVLSEGKVSQDVRDLIQRFPFTSEISVIAPNANEKLVLQLLGVGTASIRTKNQNGHQSIKFSVIGGFKHEVRGA